MKPHLVVFHIGNPDEDGYSALFVNGMLTYDEDDFNVYYRGFLEALEEVDMLPARIEIKEYYKDDWTYSNFIAPFLQQDYIKQLEQEGFECI